MGGWIGAVITRYWLPLNQMMFTEVEVDVAMRLDGSAAPGDQASLHHHFRDIVYGFKFIGLLRRCALFGSVAECNFTYERLLFGVTQPPGVLLVVSASRTPGSFVDNFAACSLILPVLPLQFKR